MRLFTVDNAIILAAGLSSRFAPITYDIPKGLISVKGEPLIERLIRQLLKKGIAEIYIVAGYQKEKLSYLAGKFGAKIIFNPEYAVKNNLSSLYQARSCLKNSYILPADIWIEENIFASAEEKNWYSCVYKEGPTPEWCVSTDNAGRINGVNIGGCDSWVMYGPAFFSKPFSEKFAEKAEEYYKKPGTENYMWENVFIDEMHNFDLYINRQSNNNIFEFDSVEELRQFDPNYNSKTDNALIKTVENVFNVTESKIVNIKNLKTGMTNKSFAFSVNQNTYIFRMPGEGTEKLINRKQEAEAYTAIKPLGISDEVVYFDEKTGYKISVFYENVKNTSAQNPNDVKASMEILRKIHQSRIQVNHSFNIGGEISRYLTLCSAEGKTRFMDDKETHEKMKYLVESSGKMQISKTLCHVDAHPDNFIKLKDGSIKLIDWEYAGMGDPIMDVSMYAIYSYYTKPEMDELLKIYLQRSPGANETLRLYTYAALGGYLWSIWAEYKQSLGAEFGDYGIRMYAYAKDFYSYLQKEC